MGRVRFYAWRIQPRWLLIAAAAAIGLTILAFTLTAADRGGVRSGPSRVPPAPLQHTGDERIIPPRPSSLPVLTTDDEHGREPPQIGQRPPAFRLADLQGNSLSLEEHEGQPIVLYFWASFCPLCQRGLPEMEQLWQRYRNELTVLGVNVQEEQRVAAASARSLQLTFPVLLDDDGIVSRAYMIRAIPALFFIDAAGVLQAKFVGIPGTGVIEAQIETLLAGSEYEPTILLGS